MQIAHWYLLRAVVVVGFFPSDFIAKLAIISSSMLTASACESVFQAFYRPLNYELVALLAITYNNYNFYYAAGETTRSWSSASHTHTWPANQSNKSPKLWATNVDLHVQILDRLCISIQSGFLFGSDVVVGRKATNLIHLCVDCYGFIA